MNLRQAVLYSVISYALASNPARRFSGADNFGCSHLSGGFFSRKQPVKDSGSPAAI
jgi:hypothetical protein